MHSSLLVIVLFLCIAVGFGGCSFQHQTTFPPPQPALDRALRIDRVIISGQPAESGIHSLPKRGVTRVVNDRNPEEMNEVTQFNFDIVKPAEEHGGCMQLTK